jgi:phosphoglycerate dehydrogenase-like enzyme
VEHRGNVDVRQRGGSSAGTPHRPNEVLVTWPDYGTDREHLGRALTGAGLTMRLEPKRGARTSAEMGALVDGAVGAIVSTDPFDAGVIEACTALRVIARVGVGVDSIDLDAATARGIAVTITPGANAATVADHTIALMLAALRRIGEHDGSVRRGGWNRTGAHTPWLLSGSTVGLVGYGQIGRLVADRLAGFDVRVLVNDPVAPVAGRCESVGLDALLAASDVISLHAPLLPATRGLIGARELGLMRPEAVLVNTARGGIVDEQALVRALESGRLRAAALDVFEEEPPRGSPLLALPNVVLSPHNAGLSIPSIEEMTRRATASVIEVLDGRTPEHLANPGVLDHAAFATARPLARGARD